MVVRREGADQHRGDTMTAPLTRIACGVTLAAAATLAAAQERPYYFRVAAGASLTQNVKFLAPFIQNQPNGAAPIGSIRSELVMPGALVGELAAGWRFAPQWRADLAFSYRGNYKLDTLGYSGAGIYRQESRVKSSALMLNGYWDMPYGGDAFRPFVGLGVGVARNSMDPVVVSRQNLPPLTGQHDGGHSSNPAVMLTAGFAIPLANGMTLDFAYRFADLGKVRSGVQYDAGVVHRDDLGRYEERMRLNEFTVGLRF